MKILLGRWNKFQIEQAAYYMLHIINNKNSVTRVITVIHAIEACFQMKTKIQK